MVKEKHIPAGFPDIELKLKAFTTRI